jgi:hypothetical protein
MSEGVAVFGYAASSQAPLQLPSGYAFRVERKLDPIGTRRAGRQVQRKIGPAWVERARAPATPQGPIGSNRVGNRVLRLILGVG